MPDQQLCVWHERKVASQSMARIRTPRATIASASVAYCAGRSGGDGASCSGADAALRWCIASGVDEERRSVGAAAAGARERRSPPAINPSIATSSVAIASASPVATGKPIDVGSHVDGMLTPPRIMFSSELAREERLPGRLGATK